MPGDQEFGVVGARRDRPVVGPALAVIGAVHVAVTPLVYPEGVRSVLSSRVIGSIEADPDQLHLRSSAFWYVTTGWSALITAALATRAERTTEGLPPWTGWALLGFAAWGAALMPKSGFWAFLAPAGLALRRARRQHRRPGAARR